MNGSGLTVLTKLTVIDGGCFKAIWSPDGSKIAFSARRALDGSDAANTNLTENIWVMNADGSNQVPLTKITAANASSFDAVWTPDGSKVLFDSARALDGSDAANSSSTPNI